MFVQRFRVAMLATALVTGLVAAPSVAAANPEGQLDTTYNGDGKVSHNLGGGSLVIDSLLDPDGRLLLAGRVNSVPAVVRLTTNGALDTTFGGGDGVATTPVASGDFVGITLQSDGRIVVAGGVYVPADTVYLGFVARFNADGSLDTRFSGDGVAYLEIPGFDTGLEAVDVDPAGRIVVTGGYGQVNVGGDDTIIVARFTATGSLDTTFNTTGYRVDAGLGYGIGRSVIALPDGAVLYSGYTTTSAVEATSSVWIGRLTGAGVPDPAFRGGDGPGVLPIIPVTDAFTFVGSMEEDRAGRILVTATSGLQGGVMRIDPDGDPDPTFADAGTYSTPYLGDGVTDLRVTTEPNGRVVLAGRVASEFFVIRLLPGGIPDVTFGDDGTSLHSVTPFNDLPQGVHTWRGRIIVALRGEDATIEFAAAAIRGDATSPFGVGVFGGSRFVTGSSRTIRWTGSDDNSGIATYDVRSRSASASSSSLGTTPVTFRSGTTATTGSFTGSAGRTYCIEARARDAAGNTSAYSEDACIAFPLNDRSLTRAGSWRSVSSAAYYRGTASRSTDSGATLRRTGVRYRTLAVVATTCSSCGKVSVYLGSTKLATLDLKSSTTKRSRVFIVDTSAAVKGGTVTIKQVSGGKPVIIEGLGVSLY